MKTNIFKPTELVYNQTVSENYTNESKKKEDLFPIGNCDGFFELLQDKLKQLESEEGLAEIEFFHGFSECKKEWRSANILGEYYSEPRHIKYYDQTPENLEIVKLHERFHAAHHLAEDQKGGIWIEFHSVSSFMKELLAQLFTYIYIRDNQSALLLDFRNLNATQPIIYQTFKLFQHYTQQEAEGLYWIVRNKKKGNNILHFLSVIEKDFTQTNYSRVIPTTKLRSLYQFLASLSFSRETQLKILKDFSRKNNFLKLIALFKDSKSRIDLYQNSKESFFDTQLKRKGLPINVTLIKNTNDAVSILKSKSPNIVSDPNFDFEYLNREINPLRTTKAIYDTGKIGSSSGGGGIDFIGWNIRKNTPILGEIKVGSDQNTFYALIQLLTYLSELATPNQITRINNHQLFGPNRILDVNTKFDLYILVCKHPQNSLEILKHTKQLAKNIQNNLHQIGDIVFLEMDENGNNIAVI